MPLGLGDGAGVGVRRVGGGGGGLEQRHGWVSKDDEVMSMLGGAYVLRIVGSIIVMSFE